MPNATHHAATAPRSTAAPHSPGQRAAHTGRDSLIDIVRVLSVIVVIGMHWLSTKTWVTGDGIHTELALHGNAVVALSWLIQPMALLFIVGGVANYHAYTAKPHYRTFVGARMMRLGLPTAVLGALFLAVSTIGDLLSPGIGSMAARNAAKPLWFLVVYVGLIAAMPLLTRLASRPVTTITALTGLAVAVDYLTLTGTAPGWKYANLAFVWAACHQLGIAFARKELHTLPRWAHLAIITASATVITVLTTNGTYPSAAVGMRDEPLSNLLPPTALLIVLAIGQASALTLLATAGFGTNLSPALGKTLTTANRIVMGAYLWHIPALLIVTGLALAENPTLFLPQSDAAYWAGRPGWILASLIAMSALLAGAHHADVALAPRVSEISRRIASHTRGAYLFPAISALLVGAGVTTAWLLGFAGLPGVVAVTCLTTGAILGRTMQKYT